MSLFFTVVDCWINAADWETASTELPELFILCRNGYFGQKWGIVFLLQGLIEWGILGPVLTKLKSYGTCSPTWSIILERIHENLLPHIFIMKRERNTRIALEEVFCSLSHLLESPAIYSCQICQTLNKATLPLATSISRIRKRSQS